MAKLEKSNKLEKLIPKSELDIKYLMWFIGFCDAEGNFQIYPKKRLSKKGEYYNIGYGFHLGIHSEDAHLINSTS